MSGLAWLTCALANVNTVVDIVDGAYMSWKIYTVIIIDGMISHRLPVTLMSFVNDLLLFTHLLLMFILNVSAGKRCCFCHCYSFQRETEIFRRA